MKLLQKTKSTFRPEDIPSDYNISQQITRAFEIHKDADLLLHNRINSFILSQSVFIGGFLILLNSYRANQVDEIFKFLIPIIPFIALSFCFIYNHFCHRLVNGMETYLKSYLFEKDIVYRNYLMAARWSHNERYNHNENKGRRYSFAIIIVRLMMLFWLLMLVFICALIIYSMQTHPTSP